MLKFLGRGAGFSDEHNGACFGYEDKLILMDCPMITFKRLKNQGLSCFAGRAVEEIVVVVTHTHSDHVAGLALTIHMARFIWKLKVKVVAPSEEVAHDLEYLLYRLDGCSRETCTVLTAEDYMIEEMGRGWLKEVIPTVHVPELEGRCFGYRLSIDGKNVIYTGDTATLEPYMEYLEEGSILYTECSAYDTGVHIYVDYLTGYADFFREKDIKVYLMHMDNVEEIKRRTAGTGFETAPLA